MHHSRDRFDVAEALVLVALAAGLLQTAGRVLHGAFGMGGIALSELLLLLAPVVLWTWRFRIDPRAGLGLVPPSPRGLAGAVLVAGGAFYVVAAGLESLQERVAPLPPLMREELRQLLIPPEGLRPLAFDLVAVAILPAICEEALFRGVMLRALLPLGTLPALLFTSLAFGAFHFSLYKMLPTATLGLLLGLLAVRAGSIVPSMVAHALNNALVVVLFRAGWEDPPGTHAPGAPLLLLAAGAVMIGGIYLVQPRKLKT